MKNLLNKCAFVYCTCDKYKDLWEPYFTLFDKYWSDCPMRIIINTEMEDFDSDLYSNLKICVHKSSIKTTWSQRLLNIIDDIDEEYIFLVVDDLFIKSNVYNDNINYLLHILDDTKNLAAIQISGNRRQTVEPNSSSYITINHNYNDYIFKDLINTKTETFPTIWKKNVLKNWIRPWESIWGFEGYGIKRAKKGIYKENVYRLITPNVFDFLWVGDCSPVINGKWYDNIEIDNFFKINNINIDFTKRGRISYDEYMSHYVSLFEHFKKYSLLESLKRTYNYIRSCN